MMLLNPYRFPSAWSPSALFTGGEQGAWYDPSDLSTLFQDTAGTVPVTASGQTVALILDKSGNGNHALQATAGSRPVFRDSGGLKYLEFDGSNDYLVASSFNMTATDMVSVFLGVRKLSDAATRLILELSTDTNTVNGSFFVAAPLNTAGGFYGVNARGTARPASGLAITSFSAPNTAVVNFQADISASVRTIEVNNTQSTDGGSMGTGNFGSHSLYIGSRAGTSLFHSGNIYGLIVRGSTTDIMNSTAAEQYLASKSGISI